MDQNDKFIESPLRVVPPMPVRAEPGQSGNWKIERFSLSEDEAIDLTRSGRIARIWDGQAPNYLYDIGPGEFTRLVNGKSVVMSNTSMEVKTHRPLMSRGRGHVLVTGLGLGMATDALLTKPSVTRITIIEASPDVIALTGPLYRDDPRVEIIHADAKTWVPPKGQVYDFAWHDIWPTIDCDNLREMELLKERFEPYAKDQACWAYMEVLKAYLEINGSEALATMRAEVTAEVAGKPPPKKKSLLDLTTDSFGMKI